MEASTIGADVVKDSADWGESSAAGTAVMGWVGAEVVLC
jgi:hypothetical protein